MAKYGSLENPTHNKQHQQVQQTRVEENDPNGSTHQQPGGKRGSRQGETYEEPRRVQSAKTAHCFGEKQLVIELSAS